MADQLERVALAPNLTVAGMWHEALRRAGIPAMVRNHDALSTAYSVPAAAFACELLVPADHAVAARELLEEIGALDPT
jgi:hypothetical protein